MTNKHQMRLNDGPFAKMRIGTKKLELRLYDEKRQKMRIGDNILFLCRDDHFKCFEAKIVGLMIYPNFNDLIDNINMKLLGYDNSERERLKVAAFNYYPKEMQDEYGVVGIHVKVI